MNRFQFQILNKNGINRIGKLTFHNKKSIQTPLTWFGLSLIEPVDFQLEVFKKSKVEAFLSNAYDLYYLDNYHKRHKLIKELQKLDLKHKIDSGGFQLMKSEIKGNSQKYPLTPELVLDKQIEIGCDCGVQLDFPFGPNLTNIQKRNRISKTLENLEQAIKLIEHYGVDFTLLPVIHTVSNDLDLLKYGLNQIEDILGRKPKLIGIGSLVPLVKKIKGSKKNGIESFLYALISLRKMLPNAFIHAFGIGGTMAYLAILAGVDSYDSNGWIQKAAYGVIQLPGISDRFLKRETHNRPYLIQNRRLRNFNEVVNEIEIFMNCNCAACKPYLKEDWTKRDWNLKQGVFTGRKQNAKLLRAIHNVSLYQSESIKIRDAIKNSNLNEFIRDRLRNSIYYKYIDFIGKLKLKSIEELNDFNQIFNSDDIKINDFL